MRIGIEVLQLGITPMTPIDASRLKALRRANTTLATMPWLSSIGSLTTYLDDDLRTYGHMSSTVASSGAWAPICWHDWTVARRMEGTISTTITSITYCERHRCMAHGTIVWLDSLGPINGASLQLQHPLPNHRRSITSGRTGRRDLDLASLSILKPPPLPRTRPSSLMMSPHRSHHLPPPDPLPRLLHSLSALAVRARFIWAPRPSTVFGVGT